MTWFRTLVRRLLSEWAALTLLVALTTVLFVKSNGRRFRVELPRVYVTDEPHYLTALNSVLWDGDVELSNNYARTHLGHVDSGIHRAGQMLDHHTYISSFSGQIYRHQDLFGSFHDPVDRDAAGQRRPRAKRIPEGGLLPAEYSWHPSYAFFLVAPLLSLLPRTSVEAVTLILIAVLTFLAALRFREMCMTLVPSRLYADLAMLAVFVGTPVLFYSRSLFPESIFVILTVFACHGSLVRGRWLLPGVYLMLSAALKPPAALLAVPIILLTAHRSPWKALVVFTMVCLGVWFSFFELHVLKGIHQAGTVVDPEHIMSVSNLGFMIYENLFHRRYGLLPFAPVLALSLLGWVPLSRRFPREAGAFLAGAVLNYAFPCLLGFYGSSYAGRYLVPLIPFLGLGFIGIWFYRPALRRSLLVAFGLLLLVSAKINLKGTFLAT